MSVQQARSNSTVKIKKLVTAALFCAMAYVAMFVTSWIKVGFLTFDAKDTFVTIAGLLFGPLYALLISLTVALLELITVGDTGFWGFLMNFLSTAAFSCTCALIYKYKKNMKGAAIGLCVGAVSMTAMMMILNLVVTPIYTGMTTGQIAAMIPKLFLPFNLAKATMNVAFVLVLYKPISRALKGLRVTGMPALPVEDRPEPAEDRRRSMGRNAAVIGIACLLIALSVVVFVVVLDGGFTLQTVYDKILRLFRRG